MIGEIVKKIDQIIQVSSSVYVYTDNCSCITKILQEIRTKIVNLPNDSDKNEFNDLFSNLNKLYTIIEEFIPAKWSQISLQTPIMKPISDLKDTMNIIMNDLQKLQIPMDKFEVSTENIVNDLNIIYGIFLDPERLNDPEVTKKREEIEQHLNELGHPLIKSSKINPFRTKSNSTDDQISSEKSNESEIDDNLIKETADIDLQAYKYSETDYTKDTTSLSSGIYNMYNGKLNSTGEPVTITEIDDTKIDEEKFKEFICILATIEHPNLESFIGFVDSPKYVIITRRSGEKLSDILQRAKNHESNDKDDHIVLKKGYRTLIAFKVAFAMAYLHSLNVMHRDLYSTNILIDSAFNPRITNFVNARYLPEDLSQLTLRPELSSSFKAPELYTTEVYDKSCDVFAFGGLLYEMLIGKPPFSMRNKQKIEKRVLSGERPSLPEETPKDLRCLIEKCWSQDSKERPSFSSIVDEMLTNKITFPGDGDTDVVRDFYASKKIENSSMKKCIELFRTIESTVSNCFVYMCEAVRIRLHLYAYKYVLQASELGTKDGIDSSEQLKHLDSLSRALESLNKTLEQAEYERYKRIAFEFPATDISEALFSCMENVYISMKKLGFDIVKYKHVDSDLARDFRRIYSLMNDTMRSSNELVDKRMKEIEEFVQDRNLSLQFTDEEIDEKFENLFSQFKDKHLNREEFKKCGRIGGGATSTVYKMKRETTGELVAVKIFSRKSFTDEYGFTLLRREIAFLATLQHKNIVEFIGYNNDPGEDIYIVMEYFKRSTLRSLIKKLKSKECTKTKIALEIAEGMEYLHRNKVIHNDLKPENILLHSDFTPKISDFGFSQLNLAIPVHPSGGTTKYYSPEFIEDKPVSYPSDVFAFGMILWELYTNGDDPFPNVKREDQETWEKSVKESILNDTKLFFPPNVPEKGIKSLILRCRSFKPEDRPTFTEIVDTMIRDCCCFGYMTGDIESLYIEKQKERTKMKAEVFSPASSSVMSVNTILTFV